MSDTIRVEVTKEHLAISKNPSCNDCLMEVAIGQKFNAEKVQYGYTTGSVFIKRGERPIQLQAHYASADDVERLVKMFDDGDTEVQDILPTSFDFKIDP